jgi:hypothetical protein
MYHVRIFRSGEAIDERDFSFGSFVEIGYWLDYYGYIECEYEIRIKIGR